MERLTIDPDTMQPGDRLVAVADGESWNGFGLDVVTGVELAGESVRVSYDGGQVLIPTVVQVMVDRD